MRRGGRLKALVAPAVVVASILLPVPAAQAGVSGPCTAQIAGTDVTHANGEGSAVNVNIDQVIAYGGSSQAGALSAVDVRLQVLGLGIRTYHLAVNGDTWTGTADISQYAWLGRGLYRVDSTAIGASGGTVCTARAYVCVTGRSIFATVAGDVALGLAGIGAIVLLVGLARRSKVSRGSLARRFGTAGLLGGVGGAVLLQQTCTAYMTPALLGGAAGGGLVLLSLVGAGIAPRRAKAPIPQPERSDRGPRSVYRFVASEGSCAACRNHATHRVYQSMEAMHPDRAHPGCKCQVAADLLDAPTHEAYFAGGRSVRDDRRV